MAAEASNPTESGAVSAVISTDGDAASPAKRQKLQAAVNPAPPTPSPTVVETTVKDDKMQVDTSPVTPAPLVWVQTPAPIKAKPAKEAKEKDPRLKDGKWSEEEEQRFLESLERFGREWDAVANHIATRDKNAIRSHAQKFFIKLYREKKPLPTQVAESGMGYTLSGKPLDPDSAAAKQYLGKSFFKKREDNLRSGVKEPPPFENFNGERDNPLPEKTLEEILAAQAAEMAAASQNAGEEKKSPAAKPRPKKPKAADASSVASTNASAPADGETPADAAPIASPAQPAKRSKKVKEKKKPFREGDLGIDIGQLLYGNQQESFRVKERLRDRVAISWKQLPGGDQDRDPLTLVKPAKYGTIEAQPFKIRVHSNAMVIADLHAHMARVEIIGFLAGHWDHATSSTSQTEIVMQLAGHLRICIFQLLL
jgi:SHAQKYF class myb-like DNA-binding protein